MATCVIFAKLYTLKYLFKILDNRHYNSLHVTTAGMNLYRRPLRDPEGLPPSPSGSFFMAPHHAQKERGGQATPGVTPWAGVV